ncbi:hypothetical protein V1477_018267 [Vespula maculifrons]|uniref:Uncharacterized protein n=1 Tax=Vespula maculifrons TaxID=7453 RepID=A0ABD2AYZ4_VESMC
MVEKSTRTHRSGKWRHTNEKRQKKRSHPVCRKSRMVEKEMGFYVPQNSTGVSKVGDVCGPGLHTREWQARLIGTITLRKYVNKGL